MPETPAAPPSAAPTAAPSPAAPAVASAPPTPPPGADAQPPAPKAQDAAALEEAARKAAEARMAEAAERRKWKEALRAKEAELADKEKRFREWEARQQDKLKNPAKYLQEEFGQDYYEKLSQLQLTGVPPADLLARTVDEKVEAVRKEFEEYKAEVKRREEERALADARRERDTYMQKAVAYVQGAEDKYPLTHAFGLVENIPLFIQQHLESTTTEDPETGEAVPGELLTFQEAAERMESHLRQKYEAATKRITPTAPTQTPARAPEAPRQTLSTRIAAQTQPSAPPKVESEAERRRRAIAAGEAVVAQRR